MRRHRVVSFGSVCLLASAAMSFAASSLGACSSFNATQDVQDGSVSSVPDALIGSDSSADSAPDSAPVSTSAYRNAVMADKPLAYWRMGSMAGRVVPDETGRGDDLVLQGATGSFELGIKGALLRDDDTAIRFDGRGGRAIATDAAPFDFPAKAPFTIELWAERDPIDAGATFQAFLSHGGGPQGNRTGFSLQAVLDTSEGGVQATAFEYNAYDGGDTRVLGDFVDVSVWAHFVATFDGASIIVYVNGTGGQPVPVNGPLTLTMTDLVVGGPTGNEFAGTIDEVAIYDHVLGIERIAAHLTAAGR
jgi:hypothetical protein